MSGLVMFLGGGRVTYLDIQRTGLGAKVGTGESEWSPEHLDQILYEGMVRNPDAYKRSKGVQVLTELLRAFQHQGHWSW